MNETRMTGSGPVVPRGLAERARDMRPGLKVLLTSGYALETLAERGRLPKGAVILNKPYRKADLAKRLREALA